MLAASPRRRVPVFCRHRRKRVFITPASAHRFHGCSSARRNRGRQTRSGHPTVGRLRFFGAAPGCRGRPPAPLRVVHHWASSRSMGGTWSRRGQILFSIPTDGMAVLPAAGGSPERPVRRLDPNCEDCGTASVSPGWTTLFSTQSPILRPHRRESTSGDLGKPGVSCCSTRYLRALIFRQVFVYGRSGTLYVQRLDTGHARDRNRDSLVRRRCNVRTGRVLAAISEAGVLAFARR